MAERHQEMVASLTADNLVFVMRLKHCEGELLSAGQERDELRLVVDEQKGPWFDEVKPPPPRVPPHPQADVATPHLVPAAR